MSRPVPFAAVAAFAWAALAAQAAWRLPPSGLTLCPFKLLTGHDCPGCGMGHAVVFAMRGDFAASFHAHPLGAPLLALWTSWLAWGAFNLYRGRGFSDGLSPILLRPEPRWAALVLILVLYAARAIGVVAV